MAASAETVHRCPSPRPRRITRRGCAGDVSLRYDQAVKHIVAAVILVVATACGDGSLGLAEYNEQGTALAAVMEGHIAALDAAWDPETEPWTTCGGTGISGSTHTKRALKASES